MPLKMRPTGLGHDLLGRVVPKQECGQRYGGADGFKVPRRDVDDQARGGATGDLLESVADGLGRPIARERDPNHEETFPPKELIVSTCR